MIRTKQCPKCSSERIAGPHNLDAHSTHLAIDLPGLPTATLVAYTCADCGYTELYSDRLGLENIRRVGRFLQPEQTSQSTQTHCPACFSDISPGLKRCPECGVLLRKQSSHDELGFG